MEIVRTFQIFLAVTFYLTYSTGFMAQVRKEEYLGCYQESEESRVFYSSPGDYDPADLSPIACLEKCGINYKYAALQEGRFCLCGNTLPKTPKLSNAQCNTPCPGSTNWPASAQTLTCGGPLKNSIYNAEERILGLKLLPAETGLPILDTVAIQANITNGINVTFTFDLGDGTMKTRPRTKPRAQHIFDMPGSYVVTATANNIISGDVTASQVYKVDDQKSNVRFACPRSAEVGQVVECNGTQERGSRVNSTFISADGRIDTFSISVRYFSAGTIVPRGNDSMASSVLNTQGVILIPAYEFQYNGKVTHWDFEVIKAGAIRLMIFRPQCSDGEVYCTSSRSCVSSSSTCLPLKQKKCSAGQMFCMIRKICVSNSYTTILDVNNKPVKVYSSRSNCSVQPPYQWTDPRADYRLLYEQRVVLQNTGHHITATPTADQPVIREGDVLGWSSEGGFLAYKTVSDREGASFEYTASISLGGKLLRTTAHTLHKKHFVIAAHFAHEAKFVIRDRFGTPGIKTITSNVTEPVYVAIDYPIRNVTFTKRTFANTNETVEFSVPDHPGSNTSYYWDFGNGETLRSHLPRISYAYPVAGSYVVQLSAENSVSQVVEYDQIFIYDPIWDFKFTNPIQAKALESETLIEWETTRGTNITYVVDFGDGTPRYTMVTSLSASRSAKTTHLYSAVGNYTVTVFAYNRVGPNVSIEWHAVVEIPLEGLLFSVPNPHITRNVYLAVGDTMTVSRHVKNGTNIRCSCDFRDGSNPVVTRSDRINHIYTQPGTYHVEITCFNDVNSITMPLNGTIVVQALQAISGLTVSGAATVYGTPSEMKLDMATGTTFFCEWSFGNGAATKTDFSFMGQTMYHNYTAVNSYEVLVTCKNRLGSASSRALIPVDVPIDSVTMKSNKRYTKVGENVRFDVTVGKGSRMRYTFNYGDSKSGLLLRSAASGPNLADFESINHAFNDEGFYTVKLNVSNSLGWVEKTVADSIVVEYPAQDVVLKSNAPVRLIPGNVTYFLSIIPNVKSPTDAFAVWDFGDDSPKTSPKPVHDLSVRVHTHSHKFNKNDTFTTTVNISNHVSSAVLSIRVRVQKLIPVIILPKCVINQTLIAGYGPDNIYFKVNTKIVLTASVQEGDVSYSWIFGDGNSVNDSAGAITNHTFPFPGRYRVQVVVKNLLDILFSEKTVIIQEPVGNVTLRTNHPTYYGDPTLFFVDVTARGSHSCMKVEFGDSQVAIFGEVHCRPAVLPSTTAFISVANDATHLNSSHMYSAMGNYSARVTLWNHVSASYIILPVKITDFPCEYPTVRIDSTGTKTEARKVKKSEPLVLPVDVKYKCPVAKKIVFTWTVFEVSLANPDDESKPFKLPVDQVKIFDLPALATIMDAATLKIKERTFPFITLKFTLKVGFVGRDRDLSHMHRSHSVWIEVEKSELYAIIKGGQRKSVGYEMDMTLDGTLSKDPDNPANKTGIEYSWWCRKDTETFPTAFATPSPTGGCYGNGVYQLNGTTPKTQVYTGAFIQNLVYVFMVKVRKGPRDSTFEQSVTILPGQPPTMNLKCNFNCLKKLNPLERLVVETICTDCKPTDVISYKWSLFRLKSGEDKTKVSSYELVEPQKWSANTSTGIDKGNMVVNHGFLVPSQSYFLRLNAWKPGGFPGGFVEYLFTVNTAPKDGSCDVDPRQGFALDTEFKVKCEGWIDTDLPLKYFIEVRNGGDVIPLSDGFEPYTSAVFPLGKKENNFTLSVLVKVMDAYEMDAVTTFDVRVIEPEKVDYNQVGSSVSSAVGSGNAQEATQVTNAVSSVLNSKADKGGGDAGAEDARADFRGEVAKSLTKMPVDSFDGAAQKGEALNALTQATGEIKADAQASSIKAMDDMGSFLSGSDSSRNLDNTAKSLFSSIGNVVGASTNTAKKAQNATGADTSGSTNNSKAALGVVDKVSGALMKQLVSGDKPKAIKTANMDLAIGRKDLSDLGKDDDDDDAEGDTGGFSMPDPAALFGGANATTEEGATSGIGSTMTAMGENPFPSGGNDLNSKTVGLSLTDGNGKPLDLSGQTLEMYVPRDLKKNPLKPMDLNHFSANDPPMRVHKFNRTTNLTAIAVEIMGFDPKIKFQIMVRFEKRPTAQHFDFNHTFPSLEEAAKMKRKPHPFTFVINHVKLRDKLLYSNESLNGTVNNDTMGTFYLGIKAINRDSLVNPNTSYAMRIYLPACKSFDEETNTWTTNGCVVGNKTRAKITHCVCRPGGDDPEDIDPTAPPTVQAGNAGASTGDNQGGPVRVRRFKRKKVSKLSLASSFFPAPNPIDFAKVFANVNFAENPIALSVVCAIFGLYLILAIYSRREDKKDIQRAGVTPLEDNDPSDRHHYEITVYTGFGKRAATTAEVSFILAGDEGEGEPRVLKDPTRKTFQRRGVDLFLATYPESLGELNYLHIWHDNTGNSPSWYLSRVVVQDLNSDKKYLFISESWLAVEEGDGTVDRLIPVAGKDEMTSFNHLFYSTAQKNLGDGHLWFSIFMRPARSRFTRLQRVSCCITLLYCSMLANAMFFNVGGESNPSETLQIGPLAFSPANIGIGIMSSLVIVPVNVFLVTVFRSVEAKPTADEMKEKKSRKYWWFYELFFCFFDRNPKKNDFIQILHKNHKPDDEFLDLSHSSRTNLVMDDSMTDLGVGDDDINFRISKQEKREDMEKKQKKKKKKKKKQLPYWFLYVAWVVCGLTCFTCAFFVVLYGLQFGREKSAQWISSMLVSFFQDVLISQPIKVIAIAVIIAAIIKKPPEEEEDEGDKKKSDDEDWMHEDSGSSERRDKRMKPKGLIRLKPPNKEKLEKDRQQRLKEMKMSAMIKEATLYIFFVACLSVVSYSHRDPTSYMFRKSMYETFVDGNYGGLRSFDSIGNRENYYDWAKTTLLNGLFKESWYNSGPYVPGFTGDGIAYVVGGARIRQLRVEKQSCEVPYQFNKLVHNCTTWYGYFAEDTGQYDIAWAPLKNESLYNPPFTFKSWEFYSSGELDSMPFIAFVSSYGGGGYAAELGQTKEHALRVIKALENQTWIDSQTRAVMTEFSTYNPVSNLFCAMTFIVEFLPTNGVYLYIDLKVSRLFATGGGFDTVLVICEFMVVVFFLIFMYQEFKQLYRMRKAYFKDFWNNIEFTMVILVITCVCMFLMRLKLVEKAIGKLEMGGAKFVSFSRVSSWSEAFMIVVALLVFTTWLKGIKLLRFNPRILMLIRTLKGAAGPLATFSIVFFVFFLSYALFAFAVFGKDLPSYYNFVTTAESVMGLLLGSFDYGEMEDAQPVLGPIYFFTFMVLGNFIIMNMFLTIIMDVFAEVKDALAEEQTGNEFELVEFMVRRFRKFTGMQPNKISTDEAEEDKKNMEEELKEGMMILKKKPKNRHRKTKPMDLVAQRFTRLDDSLKGFYCDEWAEERLLDDIVERKWGINTDEVNRSADSEMKAVEYQQSIRLDMYAALENFEVSPTDEDAFTFSFGDRELKADLSEA